MANKYIEKRKTIPTTFDEEKYIYKSKILRFQIYKN